MILEARGVGRESGARVVLRTADWWVFRGSEPVELRISSDVEGTVKRFTEHAVTSALEHSA